MAFVVKFYFCFYSPALNFFSMSFLNKLKGIRSFVFDVDGVFTDGSVLVQEDGSLLRNMNTKDGFALKHAINSGLEVFIITGGKSPGVFKRFQHLGVPEENIFYDCHDKDSVLKSLIREKRINPAHTAYMGDDIPDYEAMRLVELPTCPSDAIQEIKTISLYVSPREGGKGCVRDILEKILKVQGKWFDFKTNI